jgi:hypothetical protein
MVESRAKIVAISRILGHADLRTTVRYAHPEDSLKEAVETLANFLSTTGQFTDHMKRENRVCYVNL